MTRFHLPAALACAFLLLAACGGKPEVEPPAVDAGGATYVLEADYADAIPVKEAREKGEGDEIVVFGRVRSEHDGSGAFTIIDQTMPYCGEVRKCGCPTPWDYCCEQPEQVAALSIPVEIHDARGEVAEIPKSDLKLLDLVAVKGTLTKTESGGLYLVVKDGWFRRERPELEGKIDWPN